MTIFKQVDLIKLNLTKLHLTALVEAGEGSIMTHMDVEFKDIVDQ